MFNTDITFCVRNCGNTECKRNSKNYPKEGCYMAFMCEFSDCKEYMEVEE